MLQRNSAMIERSKQLVVIEKEINDAADQLELTWQRLNFAREAVQSSQNAYQAELDLVNNGLSRGADLLLQSTQAVANAMRNYNQAFRDYRLAELNLLVASGILLEQRKLHWLP